ncbi:MAG: galactose oxidase-like domain-containing protein [Cyanobacteria bacterium P01_D01_bin.50]
MIVARRLTQRIRIIRFFLTIVLALSLALCGWEKAIADTASQETMGAWETIPMPPQKDRMQSVHTTLLPNGKILMVSGSSFRSFLKKEKKENGEYEYKFVEGVDPKKQEYFNNSGLFDPATGTFEHIPSPPSLLYDEELKKKTGNDLFCSDQVQLSNGNVLFVGGTGRYYPGGAFTGSKWLQLYNWRTGEWSQLDMMKDGRWYPSVVTLHDGKLAIFSGLKFGTPNQINPSLEIYNPKTQELQYIDLTRVRNSPFNTLVENEDVYDSIDLYPRIFPLADGRLLITGDDAGIAGVLVPHFSKKSYLMTINETGSGEVSVSFEVGPDRIEPSKAYGTALQIPDSEDVLLFGGIIGTNSISFGRDGNTKGFPEGSRVAKSLQHWISPKNSREKNGKWEIVSKFLDKPRANLQAVILPTKEILVINGGEFPEYKPIYEPLLLTPDDNENGGYKKRSLTSAYLPRLYHNGAVLLPDGRVFIVGGNANRAAIEEDGTVHVDVIGDPKTFFSFAKLTNKSGEPEEFDIDTFYQDPQHYFVKRDEKDKEDKKDKEPFVPAEIWQPEIFSPPYLFKRGERPEILSAPDTLKYNQSATIKVKESTTDGSLVLVKLGSVTHSFDYGQRLVTLHQQKSSDLSMSNSMPMMKLPEDETLIEFKTPTNAHLYPPGYYMMFYLNDIGKPSIAKIVKLEA